MFLLYYFLFLDKTYNQNQFKDLSYVRSSHGSVLKEKVFLKILQILKKNMCWGLFLIKLWAFPLLCKYCCVLAIVEYFYTKKIELCFFFVFTSSIESVKKSLTFFFFFHIFTSCQCILSLKGFAQDNISRCCFEICTIKLFSTEQIQTIILTIGSTNK